VCEIPWLQGGQTCSIGSLTDSAPKALKVSLQERSLSKPSGSLNRSHSFPFTTRDLRTSVTASAIVDIKQQPLKRSVHLSPCLFCRDRSAPLLRSRKDPILPMGVPSFSKPHKTQIHPSFSKPHKSQILRSPRKPHKAPLLRSLWASASQCPRRHGMLWYRRILI
jgi:hypothetical protein